MRITRVIALISLVLCLALALPAAILAWLAGGHVTLTQAGYHAQAMAMVGEHHHAPASHDHLAALARAMASEGQPGLTTAGPASMGAVWQAVGIIMLLALLLMPERRVRHPGAPHLIGFCPPVALPPPR